MNGIYVILNLNEGQWEWYLCLRGQETPHLRIATKVIYPRS